MRIDLNADLGEGFGIWRLGDDDALLELVTSANVACGFHAGDPATMRRVCDRAARLGVAVGAQVGYRDLAGFGRRRMDIGAAELSAEVAYQIGALDAFARIAGTRVTYVKPHGALYNTAADDRAQADAVAAAVHELDASLPLLGLPGSQLQAAAQSRGLTFVAEGFADRAYTRDSRLLPRGEPGALYTDPQRSVAQALSIAWDHQVVAVDGSTVAVVARSICVHGDSPGAVELARRIRAALLDSGADLAPFAAP